MHFCQRNTSRLISSTSSNPEYSIVMPTELIDFCYVGKNALIRMALISIKLNKYLLIYYILKYTHKNGQNFWNNLMFSLNYLNIFLLLPIREGVLFLIILFLHRIHLVR